MQDIHARVAASQAKEAGSFDAEGPGSLTHPAIESSLYGDGKCLTPLYKAQRGQTRERRNKKTGEVETVDVRYDPDADWYTEGGNKRQVWGTKFAQLTTRREEGRFILAFERVTKDKGDREG